MPRKQVPENSEGTLVKGLTLPEYHAWLRHPVTRSVFAFMEKTARPQPMPPSTQPEVYQYRLGFYTGYWSAVDLARNLARSSADNEIEADYTGGE